MRQIAIRYKKDPQATLGISVEGYLSKANGESDAAYMVRAGQMLTFSDLSESIAPSGSTSDVTGTAGLFMICQRRYNADSDRMDITLDLNTNGLEMYLTRTGIG